MRTQTGRCAGGRGCRAARSADHIVDGHARAAHGAVRERRLRHRARGRASGRQKELNIDVVGIGDKTGIGDVAVGIGGGNVWAVSVKKWRFQELQSDRLTGLEASAGDVDRGAWRIVGLVGFDRRESVEFGARQAGCPIARAANDHERSRRHKKRAADRLGSGASHRAARAEAARRSSGSAVRSSVNLRRRQRRTAKGPACDEHSVVIGQQKCQMTTASA